jgi:hypothetical protein
MGIVDFLALVFAASAVVDVWFNGSIFSMWRAYFEARTDANTGTDEIPEGSSFATDQLPSASLDNDQTGAPLWVRVSNYLPYWFCDLVTCPFCFSHHTPWILAFGCFVPASLVVAPWDLILKIPVYSLAATRLGNIINACVPEAARYRRD